MKCWFCGSELIWSSDFSYENYGLEDEGIVSVLTCPNCGAIWEGYLDLGEEVKNKKIK